MDVHSAHTLIKLFGVLYLGVAGVYAAALLAAKTGLYQRRAV